MGYGFPSTDGDRSTGGRVTAGQYKPGMCDCTGRRLCGAYGRTHPAPLGISGARRSIQALWRTGRRRPPGTSRRNTSPEQRSPIAAVSAVRDGLGRTVSAEDCARLVSVSEAVCHSFRSPMQLQKWCAIGCAARHLRAVIARERAGILQSLPPRRTSSAWLCVHTSSGQ
jgi:hypothetical protein